MEQAFRLLRFFISYHFRLKKEEDRMKLFQLAQGNSALNLDGIHECYQVEQAACAAGDAPKYILTINISFENLLPLLETFCTHLDDPGFFFCEVPVSQTEEKLRESGKSPFHYNVYYKDGCRREELLGILGKYGKWLLPDGMACFGFASHITDDEIYVMKYKIVRIYTRNLQKYQSMLEHLRVPREEKIRTVWQNFTKNTPGTCSLETVDGKTVYDIIKELMENGLYFAERREE